MQLQFWIVKQFQGAECEAIEGICLCHKLLFKNGIKISAVIFYKKYDHFDELEASGELQKTISFASRV